MDFEREETLKTINEELHRIYGFVNSVEINYFSKEEIEEINNDLQYIRRKLQKLIG